VDKVSDGKYCSQWLDDAPFVRAECKEHLGKGRSCENCQHRNIRQEVADLRAALREGVPIETAKRVCREVIAARQPGYIADEYANEFARRLNLALAQEGTPT
jgi:hypothetical protein